MRAILCCLGVLLALPAVAEMTYVDWFEQGRPDMGERGVTEWPAVDRGSLTIYDNPADFFAATAGMELVFEDFSGGFGHPGDILSCYVPMNDQSDDPCFAHGDLARGFDIRVGRGIVIENRLVLLTPGTISPDHTLVGANSIDPPFNPTRIEFTSPRAAVALDVFDGMSGDAVVVRVYGAGETLIGSFVVDPPSTSDPAFAGITSSIPIAVVEINAVLDYGGELFTNLYFGGEPGRLVVDADPLDFGSVNTGATATLVAGFTNAGDVDLTLGALPVPEAPFSVVTDSCSNTVLPPAAACSVEFGFEPVAADFFAETIEIPGHHPDAPVVLRLAAEGVLPRLSAVPGGIRFTSAPRVGGSGESVTLINLHGGTVTVTGIEDPGGPFERVAGDCGPPPFTLGAGESCTLEYAFSPGGEWPSDASVAVSSNAVESPLFIHLSVEVQSGASARGGVK